MSYSRCLSALVLFSLLALPVSAQAPVATAALTSQTCPGSGCVLVSVANVGAVGVQITGTFSGTVSFEASIDGVTYVALTLTPPGSSTGVTSATSAGVWTGGVGGLSVVRIRCSSYSSGTAVVTLQLAPNTGRF